MKSLFNWHGNNEHIRVAFLAAIMISFGFFFNVTELKIFGISVLISHLPFWILNQLLSTHIHKKPSIPAIQWLINFVSLILTLLSLAVSVMLYNAISKNWTQLWNIISNVFLLEFSA